MLFGGARKQHGGLGQVMAVASVRSWKYRAATARLLRSARRSSDYTIRRAVVPAQPAMFVSSPAGNSKASVTRPFRKAGGGGLGRSFERDPALVGDDVRAGFDSETAADRDYSVVFNSSGDVDDSAMAQRRGKNSRAGKIEPTGGPR